MSKDDERRQFKRISFNAPAKLTQNDWQAIAEVVDVSLKGILIKGHQLDFNADKNVNIRITLSDDIHIDMTALLAHHQNHTYAFRWVQVDIESISHLRRLLELNTGDILLMERELAHLCGDY